MAAKDAPGMRGIRSRNQSGPLRAKRGDTHMGNIKKQYGLKIKVSPKMHLETYLKRKGLDSLNDLVND